jgi:predicted aspartyl protease
MISRILVSLVLIFTGVREQPQLSHLSRTHQIFALRDQIQMHTQVSDFYAGEVACAFNNIARCEERLRDALASKPDSDTAKRIHNILAGVALRQGQYRRSLQEVDALLTISPNDTDARESRPILEAISRFPDQSVQGAMRANIRMDKGKLPLLINGKKASYSFDTGANLSVISELDAVQFGMEIQNVKSGSKDINGNSTLFRVAQAKDLNLGGIELKNVAFLVADKTQQPFVDMQAGERGLIGLPVLWALGSLKWNRDGALELDRSPEAADPSAANMCFDDMNVITLARFENHRLPFILDTGADTSDLWPKFADVAGDLIRTSGTHASHAVTGMGGEQKYEVTSLPKVTLELGGLPVRLVPAHILNTNQRDVAKWFYGNLGIDLLQQAQTVTMNFKTMILHLDGTQSKE